MYAKGMFVSYKEIKPLMADLKRAYATPTEEIALAELGGFDEKWSGKCPKIAISSICKEEVLIAFSVYIRICDSKFHILFLLLS